MEKLLEVQHLKKFFPVSGGMLHAVDDVSLSIAKGETLGVVGESGCGKSTFARTLIHLLESTDGRIFFEDRDVTRLNAAGLCALRHEMQIIFQDPNSSLNPRKNVEDTILEPLRLANKRATRAELNDKIEELMARVGIDRRMRRAYPHELDGGRRQRVGIARALAMGPKFIACDEPVSALDVSIQAQILNLLQDLQEEQGLTYLFVTHDMSVVHHLADNICVMYLGQVVELSPTQEIFSAPLHPYTRALLSAVPSVDYTHRRCRIITRGELVSPIDPKPGCRFAARCPYACERCAEPQTLREIEPARFVACCRAEEICE